MCNAHPTISINDIITLFNKETGAEISPLSVEQVLAWTFNCLERLLTLYEVQGEEQLLELYYKYWLHRCVHLSTYLSGPSYPLELILWRVLSIKHYIDGKVLYMYNIDITVVDII